MLAVCVLTAALFSFGALIPPVADLDSLKADLGPPPPECPGFRIYPLTRERNASYYPFIISSAFQHKLSDIPKSSSTLIVLGISYGLVFGCYFRVKRHVKNQKSQASNRTYQLQRQLERAMLMQVS